MIDLSKGFSRRKFIANTSCFGAFYAAARLIPLPALAAETLSSSRPRAEITIRGTRLL